MAPACGGAAAGVHAKDIPTVTQFSDLGLSAPVLEALAAEGYTVPTPIQQQAIPPVLEGRDLLGIAQTGTGKTAAFALPMLERLMAGNRRPQARTARALVLSPTRELAAQIAESFRAYGRNLPLTTTVVYGGVGLVPQAKAMARGVDVLVATPGRLLDHMGSGAIRLDRVEVLVLDEADRMLDMGFILPIRRIVAAMPAKRQNLFFSATMPKEIEGLARDLLHEPARVAVTPVSSTAERVEQRVLLLESAAKRDALVELLADPAMALTLVFTRTKRGADRVAKALVWAGIGAEAIHGDKSQSQRERALAAFKGGKARVLVATDIAARGIDVEGISHVVNFDVPHEPESYVHRIGRTARAGADGAAITLCSNDELDDLKGIQRLIGRTLPVEDRRTGSRPPVPSHEAQRPQRQQARPAQKPQGPRPQGQKPQAQKPAAQKPREARPAKPAAPAQTRMPAHAAQRAAGPTGEQALAAMPFLARPARGRAA